MTLTIPDKLTLLLLVLITSFVFPLQANLIILFSLFVLRFWNRSLRPLDIRHAKRFRRFVLYFSLVAVVMSGLNALFMKEGEILFRLLGMDFFANGFFFGLSTGVRLLMISTALLILFTSTRFSDFADYLSHTGLSTGMVLTLLLTLHFLEHLPRRIEQIFTAQEARGAPVRKNIARRIGALPTILTPLLLSSVVESIERGIALELRGFHSTTLKRSSNISDNHKLSIMGKAFIVLTIISLLWVITRWLLV